MPPAPFHPAEHLIPRGVSRRSRRSASYWTLTALLAVIAAGLPAADTSLTVEDAEVVADEPGIFLLPFVIQRGGDAVDGVRILVETSVGGDNPGTPGEDYVPLPPGTEVLLGPNETSTTVNVEVMGSSDPGPDETMLFHLTGAQAFNPEPRLLPTAMHYRVCCLSRAIALADLDGNGHLDVVTGNDLSFDFSVLLSDGEGGFADAVTYPIAGNVLIGRVVVAAGDLTGNGHLDVVATGFNGANLEVFVGDGTGNLSGPQLVPLGNSDPTTSVAVADLNGDSHLDIVTGDGLGNSVSVLLSDGMGGFAAAESYAAGTFPNSVAVADVTGNGHLDIVTTNGNSRDVSVLAGDGTGAFAAAEHFSVGPDARPLSVALAEVTGDGHVDLVTANQFDGGGFPPPDTPGSVSILAGDGAGGFADAVQLPLNEAAGRAQSVAVGDVTGNGHADIVVARPINNTATLLAADGAGGFEDARNFPTGDGPNPIAIGDVTGDGHLDVVTANAVGESVSVLPGDGAGNIGFAGNFGAGDSPYSLVSVDLNGDGHPDVATANIAGNDVSVLLADGAGGFGEAASFAVGNSPTWITSGDVDGNGFPDLITANLGGGTVSVLLGDGAGGFADAMSYSVGEGFQSPYAVVVNDVDADGNLDIATANTNISNSSVSVLLGDGAGGFGDPVVFASVAQQPQSIALADVTGDGNVDILVPSFEFDNGRVALLAGDGAGDFEDPVFLITGVGPVYVVAADVTADGHPDVITLNHTAQTVSVLAADGSGGFDDAVDFPIFDLPGTPCTSDPNAGCPWPWGLAVADVTGDGSPDILTANTNNDTVSVLANDGNGDFSSFAYFDTGSNPGAVTVAEVTGDGNPDVITANRQNNNISVLASGLSRVELLDDEATGTIIRGLSDLSFVPASLDFGEVEVGSTSPPQVAILQNTGDGDLTGLQFGELGSGFVADSSACGPELGAGEMCDVSVTFTPGEPGVAVATLETSSDQGASAGLGLAGEGVGGEGFTAMALEVDLEELGSDGNRVFEPGELVEAAPAWRHDGATPQSLSGDGSNFIGPDGATYTLNLDEADYGTLDSGQTASCLETGVCYQVGIDDPVLRPATHWEATFDETLSDDTVKTWTLHIGDSFVDVPRTNAFYSSIETLLHLGITGGCSSTEYCPSAKSTRAQMPVFVLRALEGGDYEPPACVEGSEVFGDVPASHGFCGWIEELARRGVVSGCGGGNYCPNAPVTRAQMSVFLLRSLEGSDYSPPACTGLFVDVPCPSTFANWIEDLYYRQITSGCGTDPLRYCPANPVNRQQMAIFMSRTLALTLYGP